MELEIAHTLARRWARQPLIWVTWATMCALPWALAVLGPLGPDARSLFSPRIVYEVAFLWGLVGGSVALNLLGELTAVVELLSTPRRIRAQYTTLLMCILVPALPIVLLDLVPATGSDLTGGVGRTLFLGLHLAAIGILAVQIPSGPLRSIAFLSLAWLIPALVSGPIRGIVVGLLDATNDLASSSGSSAWPAACAPILALVLTAVGVDVLRRPAT